MAGYGTKRRAILNPKAKGFKKAFSFKQQQQQDHEQQQQRLQQHSSSQHHTSSTSSLAPVSGRQYSVSSGDDLSSTCSSTIDTEGLLIFPSVQRLTASSPPPLAILDSISDLPGSISSSNHDKKRLGRRNIVSKVSNVSSSSAPSVLQQARAPYQSKKAQRNLQPALKTYRRKSDYAKHATAINNSAWERRQPMSTGRKEGISFSRSKSNGRISAMDERQMLFAAETREYTDDDEHILHSGSSNSFNLPAEVSPANRFVPIGYEEDMDIFSFNSDDYDICKAEDVEELQQPVTSKPAVVKKKPVVSTSSKKKATKKTSSSKKVSATTSFDDSQNGIKQQPSLASTAASTLVESITSLEAAIFMGGGESPDSVDGKYAVPSDKYDCRPLVSDDTDWFGYISSFIISSCGAAGSH